MFKTLRDMRLNAKLIFGFAVPLVGMVGISLVIYGVAGSVKRYTGTARVESKESFELAILSQNMKLNAVQVQQWLTDISATRALDGLDDGFDEAEKNRQSFQKGIDRLTEIYARNNDRENLGKINAIAGAFEKYYESGTVMANAYISGGPAEGNKFMAGFDSAAQQLNQQLDPFVQGHALAGEEAMDSISTSIDRLQAIVFIAGAISILVSLVVAWLISRSISKPIRTIIDGLNEGANQVASASGQVSASSQELAEGSSEQAASLEESSSALEEISAMTRQNAINTKEAARLVEISRQSMKKSHNSLKKTSECMARISADGEKTAKIVKNIEEIAFQTNLLALNAAVESARAGEAGAGFAVVAGEVRNLALRSAAAAKDTEALIGGTLKSIQEGNELISTTMEEFYQMGDDAKKVNELFTEISVASDEQTRGIEEVNKAVAEMDRVVQQNAANAEESASASEEMSAQAVQMKSIVADLVFIVNGDRGNSRGYSAVQTEISKTGTYQIPFPGAEAATKRKALVRHRAVSVRPDQVIPLDDDFKDF